MDSFIREMEGQFPPKDSVYEYYVDVKNRTWVAWEDKLKGTWRYPSKLENTHIFAFGCCYHRLCQIQVSNAVRCSTYTCSTASIFLTHLCVCITCESKS